MAIEVREFLTNMLSHLPEGHPHRGHVEGLAKVNEAFLEVEGGFVGFTELWVDASKAFESRLQDPKFTPRQFKDLVPFFRKRIGMSQRVLGSRMGYDLTHWNKIEHGSRKPPVGEKAILLFQNLYLNPSEVAELCHASGCPPETLTLYPLRLNGFGTTYPR